MVFGELMYLSFQFQMNRSEIEICEFNDTFEEVFFCLRSNLVMMT